MFASLNSRRFSAFSIVNIVLLCFYGVSASISSQTDNFFEENGKKIDVVSLPSGLQYRVIRRGMGLYHPKADTLCKCHYDGKFLDGSQFESSHSRRGQDQHINIVPSHTNLKGWTEALQLMVEGDIWELYLLPELAYGETGSHRLDHRGAVNHNHTKVGPNEALIFIVELLEIAGEEKVEADDRCDVITLRDCDERVASYVQRSLQRYGLSPERLRVEWRRLEHVWHKPEEIKTQELKNWVHTRMAILERLISRIESGELPMAINERDEL